MTHSYDSYQKNVERYTNQMDIQQSVLTNRKGKAKIVDSFITLERFYAEGYSYINLAFSFIFMMVTLSALSDSIRQNFNIYWLIITVIFAIAYVLFGYISYTKLGFIRRVNELASKTDSGRFQLWGEVQILKTQQIDMSKQIDELITCLKYQRILLKNINRKINRKKRGKNHG
jgi:hypothetical protein